ncbi:hypothetical protein ZYGR_0AZ01680 [Zygosaccharomyces rouxii]|uniref:Uncharacterized protein n=1 Tax=Zygosaccharomyces rouxii TaxID=4956 RepID=A0A1Q3AJS8_ZYGRO|nr:hypothetical protein ZYGR_0AZ01680 [Zygosaccharomyces rouxii]
MGLCFSKSDQTPATSSGANETTTTQRAAVSQRSGTRLQKPTKAQQQANPERTKSPAKTVAKTTRGQTVGGTIDENKEKLAPQEAARLAAEKRFQESNEKSTRGELGKKLAQERGKSSRTQVLQEAEQKGAERNNTPLIYD